MLLSRFVLAPVYFAATAAFAAATVTTPAAGGTPPRQQWLNELDVGGRPPLAHGAAASRLRARIVTTVRSSRADLVSLRIYNVPGSPAAPEVEISVGDTAAFLRHRLQATLDLLSPHAYAHVRVLDDRGVAFDWYKRPAGGAVSFRPELESCSPVHVFGHMSLAPPPRCPAR